MSVAVWPAFIQEPHSTSQETFGQGGEAVRKLEAALKLIVLVAMGLAVAGGIWWKNASDRKKAEAGDQGTPVRAVRSYMNTIAKIGTLIWNEKQQETFKADVEKLKKKPEEQAGKAVKGIFEKYGLKDPTYLFEEKKYGKAAATAFLLFHFETFTVKSDDTKENTATITVEFTPQDILGLQTLTTELGAPAPKTKKNPIRVFFDLEKRHYKWYITGIRGELSKPIDAFSRLRGTR